jgi:hypothetical protein
MDQTLAAEIRHDNHEGNMLAPGPECPLPGALTGTRQRGSTCGPTLNIYM